MFSPNVMLTNTILTSPSSKTNWVDSRHRWYRVRDGMCTALHWGAQRLSLPLLLSDPDPSAPGYPSEGLCFTSALPLLPCLHYYSFSCLLSAALMCGGSMLQSPFWRSSTAWSSSFTVFTIKRHSVLKSLLKTFVSQRPSKLFEINKQPQARIPFDNRHF